MILRSKWFIDWSGRITENVEIVTNGRYIREIRKNDTRPAPPDSNITDLGRVVLLPGFVNAHTHLELSLAQSQVKPQEHFTDWIRQIIQTTRGWSENMFDSSLGAGIGYSIESGTTSLGDISRQARELQQYDDSNLRVRLFHEVIDFNPRTADETFDSLKARISAHSFSEKVSVGIAPHTPYTVSERLLRRCIKIAHENEWRLCIHLAETMAEAEFLSRGTGEILKFRKDFGLPPDWEPPRASPVRYLHGLGFFERSATLVHCNYVREEDFDTIARSGSSVVFCPRSHRYFRHQAHPFLKMIDSGINVALGTDSLASSPSLSMLDEIKFVRQEYPEIEPTLILRMATGNGLNALGLPERDSHGKDRYADLVAVSAPPEVIEQFESPFDILFSRNSKVIFTMADGKVLLHTSIG